MLALDPDPSHGRGATDPAAQVSPAADAITRLVTRVGGQCVTGVAPGGGRHVYVLFAAPLPWRELRDLARVSAYDLTCRSAYCLMCRLAGGLAG